MYPKPGSLYPKPGSDTRNANAGAVVRRGALACLRQIATQDGSALAAIPGLDLEVPMYTLYRGQIATQDGSALAAIPGLDLEVLPHVHRKVDMRLPPASRRRHVLLVSASVSERVCLTPIECV